LSRSQIFVSGLADFLLIDIQFPEKFTLFSSIKVVFIKASFIFQWEGILKEVDFFWTLIGFYEK